MAAAGGRLRYVDGLRGFAVLLMMQTHAYDAWLSPAAKETTFFAFSRYFGGYPAALFLFLAGVSLALAAQAQRRREAPPKRFVTQSLARAGMVLVYALLFRLWMYFTSGFRDHENFFRVDVLNCIGLSLALVTVLVLPLRSQLWTAAALAVAVAVALLTPLAWDGPWPAGTPHRIGGYVGGRFHNALFPLFPWAAYTAAGAGVGFLVSRHRDAQGDEKRLVLGLAAAGLIAIPIALWLSRLPWTIGPRFDFWWTSPNYVAIKMGVLLVLLAASLLFDRTPLAEAFRFMYIVGQASLLVYWVHVEIVYGNIVIPGIRGTLGVGGASVALALLTAVMTALAAVRLRFRGR